MLGLRPTIRVQHLPPSANEIENFLIHSESNTMDWHQYKQIQSRRDFLSNCANGIGAVALADLLAADGLTAATGGLVTESPLAPLQPHFTPKAKSIIYMFMEGGPSQYELFDPKRRSRNTTARLCRHR